MNFLWKKSSSSPLGQIMGESCMQQDCKVSGFFRKYEMGDEESHSSVSGDAGHSEHLRVAAEARGKTEYSNDSGDFKRY